MKKLTQKSLEYYFPCEDREEKIRESARARAREEMRDRSRRRAREIRMGSVASCRPPTPLLRSPPPAASAALRRLPVRRRLDFPSDGGLDDDDFLCHAMDEVERSHHEAKRHAAQGPAFREKPCICGRGPCDVVWAERGGWAYVCSASPKCSHFAWCEESDLNPNSQPAFRSHPEPSNPRVFNTPSNHRTSAIPSVNVKPQGADARPPINASPQGAGATTSVNVSLQGARSNVKWAICMCTSGKCRKSTVNEGQGSCLYPERCKLVNAAAAEEPPQTGNNNPRETKHLEYNPIKKGANGHDLVKIRENNENGPVNPDQPEDDEWPFDIVDGDILPKCCLAPAQPTPIAVVAQESPGMQYQPIAMVGLETPTKSTMPPNGTTSPVTPGSKRCFRCGEEGHWYKNCPKPPPPCYRCKEVGHRSRDCPKFSPLPDTCFHCGEVGHWKSYCPVLGDKRGF